MAGISSKEAQAHLIDPMNAPEPAEETGLNTHFGNTMAPKQASATASPRGSLSSNNPFRDGGSPTHPAPTKTGARVNERPINTERFPDHRAEAFSGYQETHRRSGSGSGSGSGGRPPPAYDSAAAGSSSGGTRPRRSSSLRERYPGDHSHEPLNVIRRDSRKANRSPHLNKRHLVGADVIDRLDPALGGRAYHHEGPYDAASLARNRGDPKTAPIAALETTNKEALKATPQENIKDALDRHKPLDGVAVVPPGETDRFGRKYNYEEGVDYNHEGVTDAGYKRWQGEDYDPEDLKGQGQTFALDRALQAHKISDQGIEMEDRAGIDRSYHEAQRKGTLDTRDPVEIAGDDGKYADLEFKNMRDNYESSSSDPHRSKSVKESLKKRIGSLRKKKEEGFDLM